MFELTNKIEANKCFSHFLFHNEDNNTVAVADHSIANLNDPSSTEDGLLVWTGEMGRLISTADRHTSVLLDVRMEDGDTSTVITSVLTACRIEQLTGLQVIPMNIEIADYKSCEYAGHQPEYNPDNYRGI
ncbi:MAG: hypothetical protein RL373_47 [Pseudomonadota bacterium]|jgi:hypothetical protein